MFVCARACAQLCLTLCNPMDWSRPAPLSMGILQARILQRVAMPSSRQSSQPRGPTHISCVSRIGKWILYHRAIWEAQARGGPKSGYSGLRRGPRMALLARKSIHGGPCLMPEVPHQPIPVGLSLGGVLEGAQHGGQGC